MFGFFPVTVVAPKPQKNRNFFSLTGNYINQLRGIVPEYPRNYRRQIEPDLYLSVEAQQREGLSLPY